VYTLLLLSRSIRKCFYVHEEEADSKFAIDFNEGDLLREVDREPEFIESCSDALSTEFYSVDDDPQFCREMFEGLSCTSRKAP